MFAISCLSRGRASSAVVVVSVVRSVCGRVADTAQAQLRPSALGLIHDGPGHGFSLHLIQPLGHVLVMLLESSGLVGMMIVGWRRRRESRLGREVVGHLDVSSPSEAGRRLRTKRDMGTRSRRVRSSRRGNRSRRANRRQGRRMGRRMGVVVVANDEMNGVLIGSLELQTRETQDGQ